MTPDLTPMDDTTAPIDTSDAPAMAAIPTSDSATRPVVVLVHGAWHDAGTWDLLVPMLHDTGIAVQTITLPSCNPGPTLPGLADDAAAVSALIDDIGQHVVLVGHSYGGMVISAVGDNDAVDHLVYLAAFCPTEGETVIDLAVGEPPPLTASALQFNDDGTMTIDPAQAIDTFYADLDPIEATRRATRLTATTASVFTTPSGPPAWTTKPVTSVICTRDRAISVDRVEHMAARANGSIVRWDTSHSPFVSQPGLVVDLLRLIVA